MYYTTAKTHCWQLLSFFVSRIVLCSCNSVQYLVFFGDGYLHEEHVANVIAVSETYVYTHTCSFPTDDEVSFAVSFDKKGSSKCMSMSENALAFEAHNILLPVNKHHQQRRAARRRENSPY